jgi:hypothetical protein
MMVAIRIKMFVHGNAVVTQFSGGGAFAAPGPLLQVNGTPWSDVHGLRQGPGVVFRGKAGNPNRNFFHVSIPSPNPYPIRLSTDQRDVTDPLSASQFYSPRPAEVINVFFRHVVDPGVILERVFAFDGGDLISAPNITGSASVVPVTRHIITAGLGVSFQVNFTQEGNITFNSVGAEFELSGLP